jgi:EAL domain-containing protein (putative c-di-GMP-specific phosphodiesterase class I)
VRPDLQRIVLVIKDKTVTQRLARVMSQEDLEIVTCDEPEAVEALLSQGPIDILIIDLPMGLQVVHHIATNFPDTVLVGLAEGCDQATCQQAEKAGVQIILERLELNIPADNPKKGLIQHFERLEDFLAKYQVAALLQPLVSLTNPGAYTLGLESLARAPKELPLWDPETLFAYAAKKEHLLETDLFCIRAAFKEAKQVPGLNKLFVNLRPRSVTHPQFVKQLLKLTQEAEFKPSQIVFELTEQQSILNLKTFLENLDTLRNMGFEIALDDFGTGFANLQWLYDLKPAYLKIAGVFCRDLQTDSTKQVLLSATTEIARKLNIKTILENIETESELEAAKKVGLDYGQGYYFCRPTSANDLEKKGWLINHPFGP